MKPWDKFQWACDFNDKFENIIGLIWKYLFRIPTYIVAPTYWTVTNLNLIINWVWLSSMTIITLRWCGRTKYSILKVPINSIISLKTYNPGLTVLSVTFERWKIKQNFLVTCYGYVSDCFPHETTQKTTSGQLDGRLFFFWQPARSLYALENKDNTTIKARSLFAFGK